MIKKSFASFCAISALTIGSAFADEPKPTPPPGAHPAVGAPGAPGSPLPSNSQVARPGFGPTAGLTEEQSKAYKAAMDSSLDQMVALSDKLREAKKELDGAVLAEKVDESAVRAKAAEVGKIETDIALAKAKTLASLRPTLNTEQLQRLARNPQFNGNAFRPRKPMGTNEMNLRPQVQPHPATTPAQPAPAPAK